MFSKIQKQISIFRDVTILVFGLVISGCANWKIPITAGKLAPAVDNHPEAVVQVYAARTKGAKSAVAVHTWISIKDEGFRPFRSYEIIGWRLKRNGSALVERFGNPDRDWWGHQPELLLDKRGEEAARLIPLLDAAIADYPYKQTYQVWPGPNSNTFIAYLGRQVPDLHLDLPATAIGKDYRPLSESLGFSSSGTGVKGSLWGLLGLTIGWEEGIEFNLLGLSFELDLLDGAVELPVVGRIGPSAVKTSTQQDTDRSNVPQTTR